MTTDREKIVEAMARAMFSGNGDARDMQWDDMSAAHLRPIYLERAGNALDALIEHGPTEGMAMAAASKQCGDCMPTWLPAKQTECLTAALAHLKE